MRKNFKQCNPFRFERMINEKQSMDGNHLPQYRGYKLLHFLSVDGNACKILIETH